MSSPRACLSYGARREVLAQIAPRYQQATDAQKTLMLDQIVKLTGYARKYVIQLLNHVPESATRILRPRPPFYGSAVQEALFLAWRTIQYPYAQRLVPCLPTLIPVLERDEHLHLDEEPRRQLLTLSIRTAERLLSTQHRPATHGISATKPATLLKHQIPIRTFAQWDDHRPGFLEADLVAHCGGNVFGGYLYTLTLTDIATGWTECLPLLHRSPETVLAVLQRARALLPFPMLGLDTDNGGEFLNAVLFSYCQQEQITFTRSRPQCSNDNCHVEQKNGEVVCKIVGYDRLVSMLAYRQLGELYQASRLLVNYFQPSMKLQAKHIKNEHEHRIYDEAKTPLQRVLLSGVLPDEIRLSWRETAESLDPLRLVQDVEPLQRAVWRCAEGSPGTTLVCFSLNACVSVAMPPAQRTLSDVLVQETPDSVLLKDWSQSMDDPFLGEWEQIHAYVRTYPMASAGEILREWQRRFSGCFVDAHLNILQRRLREIHAHLLVSQAAPGVTEGMISSVSGLLLGHPQTREASPQADGSAALPHLVPVSSSEPEAIWPFSVPSTSEEKARPVLRLPVPADGEPLSEGEEEHQHGRSVLVPSAGGKVDALFPVKMTIDQAIHVFLQAEHTHKWEPKTREWHETSLSQLQRYLVQRGVILLCSLTSSKIRGWLTFLRTEVVKMGRFRGNNTISTYARSAHAFCNWLVGQGYVDQSPFAQVKMPKKTRRPLQLIEQETFECLLHACHVVRAKRATTVDYAAVRNRALLWILWDTDLLISEGCALNVGDVDLAQSILHVQGTGSRGRALLLTPPMQQALTVYLEQYRLRAGKTGAHEPFFLSEQRARLTPNVFTQLFQRLCTRAGLEDHHLTPTSLREMFAIRFLQAGVKQALQRLLGLKESTPIKRYQDAARALPHRASVSDVHCFTRDLTRR